MNINFIIKILYILFSIKKIYSEKNICISQQIRFNEIGLMKCITILNGNNVCLERNGIFTYNSLLTKILFKYNFNISIITDQYEFAKNVIVEFKDVEKENDRIILCFINHSNLYTLSKEGKYLFNYKLEPKLQTSMNYVITPYKFDKEKMEYYFMISFPSATFISIIYNKINIFYRTNEIINKLNYLPIFMKEGVYPSIDNKAGSSCEILFDKELNDVLTCFFISSSNHKYITSVSFSVENNFTVITNLTYNIDDFNSENFKLIFSNKNEKSKALVCFTKLDGEAGCFIYNSTDYSLSKLNFTFSDCGNNVYSSNLYYFEKNQEFIFSCENDIKNISIIQISKDFNFSSLQSYEYGNSQNQYGYSIIYMDNLNIYNIYISNLEIGKIFIKSFLLVDNNLECDKLVKYINETKFSQNYESYSDDSSLEKELNDNIESTHLLESSLIKIVNTQKIETSKISESSKIIESSQLDISKIIQSSQLIVSSEIKTMKITESYGIIESSQIISSNQMIKSTKINNSIPIIKSYQMIKTSEIESSHLFISNEIIISSGILESSKFIESSEIINTTKIIYSNKVTNTEIEINEDSTKKSDIISICDEKCSECNKESNENNLCVKCNNEKYYFEIKFDNSEKSNINEKYVKCITEETKPLNYFFDKNETTFKSCYYTCGSCIEKGNQNEQKCLTCKSNYISDPNNNENCIIKCKYYFYYSIYEEYKCTNDNQCPEEASLLIPELSKCTDNCKKEKKFKYQYNGQCIEKCPEDTTPNIESNICEIKEINICSFNLLEFSLDNDIQKNNVEKIVKNYAKEYSYTNNHISKYFSDEYTIIIYKNSLCIKKLELNIPIIDFGECYEKVKDFYSIKEDLIIAIIDKYSNIENSKNGDTTYAFFHPETGQNLNASEICKEIKIVIEENILSIIDDNKNILFFADQNVNIFNISNEFYTDICYHFESPNKKDIILKDRIKTYYPNVTLCDYGCKNIGINLTSLTALCECIFKDLLDNSILKSNFFSENIIMNELINQVKELIEILNLEVMKCYKTIFDPNYIVKCIGGFIILSILVFEIICIIIFKIYSIKYIVRFLYIILADYIDFLKSNIQVKRKYLKYQKEIKAPTKKTEKNSLIKIKKYNNKLRHKNAKNINININMAQLNINKINQNFIKSKSFILKKKKLSKIQVNKYKKKRISFDLIKNDFDKSEFLMIRNIKVRNRINFEEYLTTPFEEMDYEDAIIEDKRNFCSYFISRIKSKHIIINTFFISDNIESKSIKILVFLTKLDLYFLINSMLFNEKYISELFHNEKEGLLNYISLSINRYIYTTFVGTIINYLIKCFFIKEKKFIKILIRYRQNHKQLYNEFFLFIQKLKRGYNIFIFICILLTIFSWYYISCFNNVYQYAKKEWAISSIIFFIISNFLKTVIIFFETFLRYLSFKLESDKIYKLSNFIAKFE